MSSHLNAPLAKDAEQETGSSAEKSWKDWVHAEREFRENEKGLRAATAGRDDAEEA